MQYQPVHRPCHQCPFRVTYTSESSVVFYFLVVCQIWSFPVFSFTLLGLSEMYWAQGWLVHVEQREALARAHHGLGRAYWRLDRRDEARAAFERVIALLENRCCTVLVEALADLAVLLTVYISLQEEGSAYAQQALVMAHQL